MSSSFVIPWSVVWQLSLSMGFPKQEHWSWLPFPSPGDLPNSGIEPTFPALAGGFFTTEPSGKPYVYTHTCKHIHVQHTYICYMLLNQSSPGGHLGCFHAWLLMHSDAMNIGVHVSFWIGVLSFLDIYSGVGLLNYLVGLFLIFKKASHGFTFKIFLFLSHLK